MNIQNDLDILLKIITSNFINFLTHCTSLDLFIYQALKLKQYSLYRLIVQQNPFSFEQINLKQVYRQNTSLTKVLKI